MKLLQDMLMLCIGVLLYAFMADRPYQEAFEYMYWLCFGGCFVWFKNGLHKPTANR